MTFRVRLAHVARIVAVGPNDKLELTPGTGPHSDKAAIRSGLDQIMNGPQDLLEKVFDAIGNALLAGEDYLDLRTVVAQINAETEGREPTDRLMRLIGEFDDRVKAEFGRQVTGLAVVAEIRDEDGKPAYPTAFRGDHDFMHTVVEATQSHMRNKGMCDGAVGIPVGGSVLADLLRSAMGEGGPSNPEPPTKIQ